MQPLRFLLPALALALAACTVEGPKRPIDVALSTNADLVPTLVAFDIDWKHRVDQPYVYLEVVGNYDEARRQLPVLAERATIQGVRPSGPPFILFYDDPARVPENLLRARVCWPVATTVTTASPIGFDVLPAQPVLYGFVRGPYGELESSYGGMFEVLRERSWVLTGPIRETYHVDPGTVQGPEELLAELQMPWKQL